LSLIFDRYTAALKGRIALLRRRSSAMRRLIGVVYVSDNREGSVMSTVESLDAVEPTQRDQTGLVAGLLIIVGIAAYAFGLAMAVPTMGASTGWGNLIGGALAMGFAALPAFLWLLATLRLPAGPTWFVGILLALIAVAHPVVAQIVSVTWLPLGVALALSVVCGAVVLGLTATFTRR